MTGGGTRPRLGVLASHEGTTLQAVIDASASGAIDWEVAVVVSNNADAGALRRARAAGIRAHHLSGKTHGDPAALDRAIRDTLTEHRVDLVLLAGYMKKVGPATLAAFPRRVLNTHPGLLPKYGGQGMYGAHVHQAVLAAGEHTSGVSVHLVDAEYDTGPVIACAEVPVAPDDTAETLAARVQTRERLLLVEVLARIDAATLPLTGGILVAPSHAIVWRRLDCPGHEAARLSFREGQWHLDGTSVFVEEGRPCRLDYAVVADARWHTVSASVRGFIGDAMVDADVSVDSERRWRLSGQEVPAVAGATDVDLNWSPSTNLLPIRRLNLDVGQEATVRAAWLRFPSLRLEPLEQRYRRIGPSTYRYESGGGTFVAELEANAAGLIVRYPDFVEAEPADPSR